MVTRPVRVTQGPEPALPSPGRSPLHPCGLRLFLQPRGGGEWRAPEREQGKSPAEVQRPFPLGRSGLTLVATSGPCCRFWLWFLEVLTGTSLLAGNCSLFRGS